MKHITFARNKSYKNKTCLFVKFLKQSYEWLHIMCWSPFFKQRIFYSGRFYCAIWNSFYFSFIAVV